MDFQDQEFPIVFIWWMIEKNNFQLLKNLHFDKRKNLNDKIQFSFLILTQHLLLASNLMDGLDKFGEEPAKILLTLIILWCNFTFRTKEMRFWDKQNSLWDA